MNQQELQELQEYIKALKREAHVWYLGALEETNRFYCLGYKTACEFILDKIKRLEKKE